LIQVLVGSWVECINPFDNPVKHFFFRLTPDSKYFTQGDVAKLCPICWEKAHKRNNPISVIRPLKGKSPDSKPEKDSL